MNLAKCPKFDLGDSYIAVTVPAVFPTPESIKTFDHFRCGGYSFDYSGKDSYSPKKLSITGLSWEREWVFINQGSISSGLDLDTSAHLVISEGVATFASEFASLGVDKGIVLGISINGGKLKPILFDGKTTPQKIGSGINHFYQKGSSIYGKYMYIDIDTLKNSITLTPNPDY